VKFLSFIGKRLKDDDVINILDRGQVEVVYDFDRSHENIPDRYWAGIPRDWVRLEHEKHAVHYEFRSDQLALVTITKSK